MTETIAQINDRFRQEVTEGESDLGALFWCGNAVYIIPENKVKIIRAIRAFVPGVDGDDSHGEHEQGTVEVEGRVFNWRISYYDREFLQDPNRTDMGSEDPSNLEITVRHLNVTVSGWKSENI